MFGIIGFDMVRAEPTWRLLNRVLILGLAASWTTGGPSRVTAGEEDEATEVVLVKDGRPKMPVISGSVPEPAAELHRYLKEISGADFELVAAGKARRGIHVGLASDFPQLRFENIEALADEGFLLRSDGKSLYLVGNRPRGVQHAVTTFLHDLGCRWFFPGSVWEVIPRRNTIAGTWHKRQTPAFAVQRRIWPGYGLYAQNRRDWELWDRHNRMGGPVDIHIGHTFNGLKPDVDFQQHPEWFALVDGRRQPSKPCYSHPEVVKKATEYALQQAAGGEVFISMSAPDGLGYCECPRCLAVLRGAKPFQAHGTTFGRRPDGELVNVTSETLFALVNRVAAAVAEKYPHVQIGCYAYSAYSHPPSFKLHPNVYIQTTTDFRRTPLSLEDQLAAWNERTTSLGIREYYSVYQWDWDEPYPGRVRPDRLQQDLRFFREHGVTAVNAEASNNWGPRGLGYYVASQLMWDPDTDVAALVQDFYQKAFGSAAAPIKRYYARWYRPAVGWCDAVATPGETSPGEERRAASVEDLKAAFDDLEEATRLVEQKSPYRRRVDQLRMYLHYLVLRHQVREAAQDGNRRRILAAIEAETTFGGRLNDTNMIHTRPLIGKAFPRRFRKFEKLLSAVPEAQTSGKGWRRLGNPPTAEELQRLWAEDRTVLRID